MNIIIIIFSIYFSVVSLAYSENESASCYLSPEKIIAANDGNTLYFTEKTARRIAVFHIPDKQISHTIALPGEPTGLVLSPNQKTLYVTCSQPIHSLCVINLADHKISATIPTGVGPCSPVLEMDRNRLFICNQFDNSISVIDLEQSAEIKRIPAGREPIAAVLVPNSSLLFIADHLPSGVADADRVAASITVIDAQKLQKLSEIALPNGSTCLQDLCLTRDGKFLFVPQLLSRYTLPTTQLDKGWMINNALSIIDVSGMKRLDTVLLDDMERGAANPWAAAVSLDGQFIYVLHAGSHELSRIDLPALLQKVQNSSQGVASTANSPKRDSLSHRDSSTDLTFLNEIRRRIPLQGNGPRGIAFAGQKAYITLYYSDKLNAVDLLANADAVSAIPLAATPTVDKKRLGEMIFHDADLCFQGWQSCAGCHPDGRMDGLNWDLLNDGLGNPKNTKSLLYAFNTPPSMSVGIREDAQAAVRSGLIHILFSQRREERAAALDEYLKSLTPLPSPILLDPSKTFSIQKGQKLFFDPQVGCAMCHNGTYYTDMKPYDVGTQNASDLHDKFDTPTLLEIWRTAPYLHDGSAATLRDVLTVKNHNSRHGNTVQLSENEIADLEVFLLSL